MDHWQAQESFAENRRVVLMQGAVLASAAAEADRVVAHLKLMQIFRYKNNNELMSPSFCQIQSVLLSDGLLTLSLWSWLRWKGFSLRQFARNKGICCCGNLPVTRKEGQLGGFACRKQRVLRCEMV